MYNSKFLKLIEKKQLIPTYLQSKNKLNSFLFKKKCLCASYYGGETLALNDLDLQHLQYNDRAMLSWICGVKASDCLLSEDLLAKLHFFNAAIELCTLSLRWFVCQML